MSLSPNDPLSALKRNPFSPLNGLKYPSSLGSSRYGHYMTFTAMVSTSSKYKGETTQKLGSSMPNLANLEKGLNALGSGSFASSLSRGIGNISAITAGILSGYDQNISSDVAEAATSFASDAFSSLGSNIKDIYTIITSPGSVSPVESASLYTPDSVSLGQLVSYSSISKTEALGNLGLGVESIAQGASIAEQMKNGGSAKQSLMGSTFNNPIIAEGIGKGGESVGALGKGASEMTLAKAGFAKNPQLEVIFKQVEFRTYQFNFTFTPKNAQEAQEVKKIIKFFRKHQLPELDQGGAGRYFVLPSFFQLEHFYQGSSNDNLHKFAPCVLTSIFIDYAPNGWVTYEDAFPVQTSMILAFQEIEIMTKERIEQGY